MAQGTQTIRGRKCSLSLLPMRGLVIFPAMILHFDVGRKKSIDALEAAMANNQHIFLVTQKDVQVDDPGFDDLHEFGTVSEIKQILKLPGGNIRVLVEGLYRAKLLELDGSKGYLYANVCQYPNRKEEITPEAEAAVRMAKDIFDEYMQSMPAAPKETVLSVMEMQSPGQIADVIASNVFGKLENKIEILCELNGMRRIEKLIVMMQHEMEIGDLERQLGAKIKEQIDKNQREYFLREQLKVIQTELGDNEGPDADAAAYKERILALNLPAQTEEKLLKDAQRLGKMPPMMNDSALLKAYLDTVLELPWNRETRSSINLARSAKILNQDHYGLEQVKERVLEFLAVRNLNGNLNGQILCLVGPPGVGKTSVAKSIAKCMGRQYARVSLGGVRDEADIRGHRKTYIGAMPGRIINAVKQSGSKNPLILLDEIDKMGHDFRGDPASAMLEVLDAEQNSAFRDHYIEVPFDLSEVVFITTANTLDTVPRPLLDRMEVIELSTYTALEKLEIAKRHLIPKQRERHGLSAKQLKITDGAVNDIVAYYTRESGVRNLEREIASVCRKAAKMLVEGQCDKVNVTEQSLSMLLGKRKYRFDTVSANDEVGVVTGLAWAQNGGDTLQIEVNIMDGTGKTELTGHLGDVMKESAKAAISYVRSRADKLGIDAGFYKNKDIHIHVPEGAVPKDGPSAGVTMTTALVSALKGCPVRRDVAMTGEVTIRGRVLPIGGLKEKSLAAYRAGIKTVIIPDENRKDLEHIPEIVKERIRFVPASDMDLVLDTALLPQTHTEGVAHREMEGLRQ